jgi:hypothetical protein
MPQGLVDIFEPHPTHIADAAPPCDVDGTGRWIDRDDIAATRLELQRHSSRSASDVEHTPADVPQGSPLDDGPPPDRREVLDRGDVEESIVALDDLVPRSLTLERIKEHPTEGIVHACTLVRAPRP